MMSASNDSNSVNSDLLTKLLDDDDEKFDDIEWQKHENQKTGTTTATSNNSKKNIVVAHAIPLGVTKQQKYLVVELYTGAGTSSCCWWSKCVGCTLLSVTVFGTVLLGMVSYWLYYGVLGTFVHDFTVESTTRNPHQLPIVPLSEREQNEVIQRVETFMAELFQDDEEENRESNELGMSLVLTQDEINGVIGGSEYLRGNMLVSLHPNVLEEEYSLPMSKIGFQNRYFVGDDYLKATPTHTHGGGMVELQLTTAKHTHEDWFNGPMFFAQLQYLIRNSNNNHQDEKTTASSLFLQQGSFFGQVAPQDFLADHYDLLEFLYEDYEDNDNDIVDMEDIRTALSKIQTVSLQEGYLAITAKQH